MLALFSEDLQHLVHIVAGDKAGAALDGLLDLLLIPDAGTYPGLAVKPAQEIVVLHLKAVNAGTVGEGVGIAQELIVQLGNGIKHVLAVLISILVRNILVELAVEGIDDDPVRKAVVIHDLQHPVGNLVSGGLIHMGILLQLDVHRHVGQRLHIVHELDEGGDPAAGKFLAFLDAGIQLLQLGQGIVLHKTRAVGGAVHGGIVMEHQFTVGGDAHVGLDLIHTQGHGGPEGLHGVLGVLFAEAPVGSYPNIIGALCPNAHSNASLASRGKSR